MGIPMIPRSRLRRHLSAGGLILLLAVLSPQAGAGGPLAAGELPALERPIDPARLDAARALAQAQRDIARGDLPSAQINPVDDMSTFRLHRLAADPEVPVVVGCRPLELNEQATLVWESNGVKDQRPPEPKDWTTILTLGEYTFRAEMNEPNTDPPPEHRFVRPPYRIVHLGGQE